MRRRWLRALAAAAATPVAAFAFASAPAQADPGVQVYPGMEVLQGTNVCTLGYVDPQMRIAFTAGHCRGDGTVRDNIGIGLDCAVGEIEAAARMADADTFIREMQDGYD